MAGVLCDQKISARNKGKVYKAVVRLTMNYEPETWPIIRVEQQNTCGGDEDIEVDDGSDTEE